MARPLWKGSLSFGLVNIPVGLYPAQDRHDLQFTMLDSRNLSRIRYQRINERTGEEVPWNEIVKGYEIRDGDYVILTPEDFKRAAVEATKTIAIEDFVDRDEIDPVYFETPYYVLPEKGGEHAFEVLRQALARSGKVGIAKVVIRARQHLAAVMPHEHLLVLDVLRFNQELRPPAEVGGARAAAKEVEMAERLVETMVSKWNPEKYHDEYHDALLKWIKAKAAHGGKMLPAPAEPEERTPASYNIMELLRKSVSERGRGRAGVHATRARRGPIHHGRRRRAG